MTAWIAAVSETESQRTLGLKLFKEALEATIEEVSEVITEVHIEVMKD